MADDLDEVQLEFAAMAAVYAAIKELPPDAQRRVVYVVSERLKLGVVGPWTKALPARTEDVPVDEEVPDVEEEQEHEEQSDEGDGISSVAKKWIRRSGLSSESLGVIFSLSVDQIDLISDQVPGETKKEKFRAVLFLKGVAAYLATGVARVDFEDLKETSSHYDAYDASNFSMNMKSFAKEVGGDKDAGFTLTPKGLTDAASLIKQMLEPATKK